MPKPEEIKELEEDVLNIKESGPERERVKIVFDGKQYNLRIPKRFAETVPVDPNRHMFEFTLVNPLPDEGGTEPKLTGKLVESDG